MIFIKMKVDALFISDIHLGSKGSNAEHVLKLLKEMENQSKFDPQPQCYGMNFYLVEK
jgi:hypothetical protein